LIGDRCVFGEIAAAFRELVCFADVKCEPLDPIHDEPMRDHHMREIGCVVIRHTEVVQRQLELVGDNQLIRVAHPAKVVTRRRREEAAETKEG